MKNENTTIAYFSAEIGISSSLPTYSGGLGVLAGDHIKASADLGLPMVGISLLYKEGYFKQQIDSDGNQIETYPRFDISSDLRLLPDKFTLKIKDRDVWVQAYQYLYESKDGHSIPIYFLDTDLEDNLEEDKNITLRLYSGDKDHRILQESILGFGGIRLLETLGYKNIKTYHMNEGHSSFLTLALLKKFDRDEEKVRSMCHFTTHTPVAAGHDQFSVDRCRNLLGDLIPEDLKLPSISKNRLHMTELGLYFSKTANGVSRLHGQVAQDQFPDFKIDYITNGVYHPHWVGKSFKELFDTKIKNWRTDPSLLLDMSSISDDDLEESHKAQKQSLIDYVNLQTKNKLSHDILTIGFARRSAEYKRARLIFSDIDRLVDIGKNKIQIIFSGKAHPKDVKGKQIIREVVQNANKLMDSINIVFIENYNMWLGHLITSGVDVWLNTPLRPNEASGTSGMKATLNGVPNFSILDGWWDEGCIHGQNGWEIGTADLCDDKLDSNSLYQVLENSVIPTFYNNKERWIQIMKNSIRTGVDFTAHRMVKEYQNKFYKSEYEVLDSYK